MPLTTGTRLGPYLIQEMLGAGGMGEVYRATDTLLKRSVAVKVLPASVASEPERLARFQREAEVLAALNDPHIAQIHGVEKSAGLTALIMELVEGPTLAERIAKGPIPINEALDIAKQIADALEIAHGQGIVHRDLKPANIKRREDGTVKVLDFGLAREIEPKVANDFSNSPTTTDPAITMCGGIIGTPSYMSPEQARGMRIDKRTDIWTFGCVLYELLSGRRAFDGGNVSEIIAAILHQDPNWRQLPSHTPTPIRRLLRRCLEKDLKRRLRDAGDAVAEIEDALHPPAPEQQTQPETAFGRRGQQAMMLMTSIIATALTTVIVLKMMSTSQYSQTRFTIENPSGLYINEAVPALSPDGRTLVFSACSKCGEDLDDWVGYRRPLDDLRATPIAGTEGAFFFFFSPDGRSVGFTTRAALKRVSLDGGPPMTLHEGPVFGADWGPDGSIIFGSPSGLMRISAAGGQPERIRAANPSKLYLFPAILPEGRAVLTTVWEGSPTTGTGEVTVVSLDRSEERPLVKGTRAHFLPTGHVIFARDGSLWAAPFDHRALEMKGGVMPVLDSVFQGFYGSAPFAIATNGTVAYVTGHQGQIPKRAPVWIDRDGSEHPLELPPAAYGWSRVSPDGKSVAVDVFSGTGESDILIYDIARRTSNRLTVDRTMPLHSAPVWTPDSQEVVFTTGPPLTFASIRADGSGKLRDLLRTDVPGLLTAATWAAKGKMLLFNYLAAPRMGKNPAFDIGVFGMDGKHAWEPLIHTDAAEMNPAISPDGTWIAYNSNTTGRFEVHVERFPELDKRLVVSRGGGVEPVWSANGKELFYRSLDGKQFLRVEFDATSGNLRGSSAILFEGPYPPHLTGVPLRTYDITPDGKRFIVPKEVPQAESPPRSMRLNVVLNWFEELKRRASKQ
jgi:serine/threonine-protein kinase